MTDEDERMDRARRIREMREGTRASEEPTGEDADAADGTEASDAEDHETDAGEDTTDGDGSDDDPTGSESSGPADAAASATADGGAVENGSEPGPDATPETEDGGGIQVPGAEVGDVAVDPEELAQEAGLAEVETSEGAVTEGGADGVEATPAGMAGADAADASAGVATAAETRVLEFDLGTERYCLDIEYVEEIVKRDTVTRVPNTPEYVEGVVDLRGQITTILDPKELLDIDDEGSKQLIVVFDPDEFEEQGAIGWVVDDVNQVMPIAEAEVNDSPVEQDHINGVVDRDGEFVIWTTPKVDIEAAGG